MDVDNPIKDIKDCQTVEDIEASLTALRQDSAAVTRSLQSLVSETNPRLVHDLQRLDILRAQLSSHHNSTRALTAMLSDASAVASRLSRHVRQLDKEQSRVAAATKHVEMTQDLRSNIQNIYEAADVREWETVANSIHRIDQLPAEVINGEFTELMVPSEQYPDSPKETLANARQSFGALFLREFESAAKDKDVEKLTRFFKLFPLIGKEKEGLDSYAKFVCTLVADQSRAIMSNRVEGPLFFGMAMSRLFENIAAIVNQHSPIVERYYGKGKMNRVMERIQLEADAQGGIIIDSYMDDRNVGRKLADIKSYAFGFLVQSFLPSGMGLARTMSPSNGNPTGREDEGVNVQEVDKLLSENALMLSRWSLYCKFMAVKWKLHQADVPETTELAVDTVETSRPILAHERASSNSDSPGGARRLRSNTASSQAIVPVLVAPKPAKDTLVLPSVIQGSKLYYKINDRLAPAFETMATFFFRRSVEKAFQLDETPRLKNLPPEPSPQSPIITSAVDDVMYVLNAILERAISTGQVRLIKNVCANVRRVLESDFIGMVQRKMRDETYPKPTTTGGLPPDNKVDGFLVLMNNLSVGTEYVDRLVQTLLRDAVETDQNGAIPFEKDVEAVAEALRGLATSFDARVGQLLADSFQVIFVQVVKPRLRIILTESFKDANYLPQPDDGADGPAGGQQSDLLRVRFVMGWDSVMRPLKRILTERNYGKLLQTTAEVLSDLLEKRVWSLSGRVNELGAIQLERDIAGIISYVSQGKWYSLREKFTRAAQLVMAIGMDDPDLESAGIDWALTAEERRRAAVIRVDE
ncbi:COG4 transport protein-domain-containing protein [Dipodascopsis tothii]|uniref:COG4 transport protein-domain-containing protein n=1 Tax=Dipodascopsis tothii TaxID=44089 RepID=UPI0034D01252